MIEEFLELKVEMNNQLSVGYDSWFIAPVQSGRE